MFFFSASSLGFSANAEVTADAYTITTTVQRYYFLGDGNVITDTVGVDLGFKEGNEITNNFLFPYDNGYEAVSIGFQFPDKKYVVGQTYQLKFDISTNQNYIYSYFFPNAIILDELDKQYLYDGDVYYPGKVNSLFLSSFSESRKEDMLTKSYSEVREVTFDISIPDDYMSSFPESYQRVIPIYLLVCLYGTENRPLSSVTYSNIRLVPTGATEYLYQDKVFHDDVIGSDDGGGLKGIFKALQDLPVKFSSYITGLGDRIGGFFTTLKDNLLQGIKDLFIPTEEQITAFKDKTDLLLSQKLGVLYQAPDLLVDFFGYLADFEPLRSDDMNDYYLEVPAYSVYINSDADTINILSNDDNGGEEIPIIPDNTGQGSYQFRFGFLAEKPFSTFYGFFKAAIIFISIMGFCYYALNKYNKVMGG